MNKANQTFTQITDNLAAEQANVTAQELIIAGMEADRTRF